MTNTPQWLQEALAVYRANNPHPKSVVIDPVIQVGDIRRAHPTSIALPLEADEDESRLVLIVQSCEGFYSAMLLTTYTEMGYDQTVRLEPEETGLAYVILVETEMIVSLFPDQIDDRVFGKVNLNLLAQEGRSGRPINWYTNSLRETWHAHEVATCNLYTLGVMLDMTK